jgi:hypothetical protein
MYTITIALFTSILLLREWSISLRIKTLLKLDPFKQIKLIECFPCFSFWTSVIVLIFTQENIIYSLATYVIASILDKLWN